jgi:uncharacterized protein (DUF58 family)
VTVRPTSRGWWVLLLAVAGLGLGAQWRYPGLTGIGAALALLAVVDAASLGLAGGLTARRTVAPLEVPRYGECLAQLEILHDGRWFAMRAEAVERVADQDVDVELGRVEPGEGLTATYQVPTARRGRLTVGPLLVRRYGFAGLTVRTNETGGQVIVRVLPRVLPVRAMPPGARRGHVGAEERVAQGGTDIVGLHEYAPGDDLRRVHWATTARIGTLMVREDADPARAHLAVVLDDRSAAYPDADAFEDAVEVAASLLRAGYTEGHPVRLRTIRGGLDIEIGGPVAGVSGATHDVLAPLADVSLVDSDDSLPGPLSAPGDLDVLAVVTGAGVDVAILALEASRAEVGAVLAVDASAAGDGRPVAAGAGSVVVLRGAGAEALLGGWDRSVSFRGW